MKKTSGHTALSLLGILFLLVLTPLTIYLLTRPQGTYDARSKAVETLTVKDQFCANSNIGSTGISKNVWKAQTFSPSVSGNLTYVTLPGNNDLGTTTLHIQPTNNGIPAGNDLGSAVVQCGTTFDFGQGIPLQKGILYTLVLSNTTGSSNWQYSNSDTCYQNPQGNPFTSTDNGTTWGQDSVDFLFTTYMSTSENTLPLVTPPVTCTYNSAPAQTKATVFALSLPTGHLTNNPEILFNAIAAGIKEGSRYHGYVNKTVPAYIEFEPYGGHVIEETAWLPQKDSNGTYNYQEIYDHYGLCSLIQEKKIDEVWLFDSGEGGFAEYVTVGPEGVWSAGGHTNNPPNCGKEVTTLVYNANRGFASGLHSYGHRLEGLFMHYFPCEFWTNTWPWTGWPSQCQGKVSDKTGYVGRPFSGNANVGVCGDIHHPPNITSDTGYDYENTTTVSSTCKDWQESGSAVASQFNCSEWNCDEGNFYIWWMQNLPGLNNTNKNPAGQLQPNWWALLKSNSLPIANFSPNPTSGRSPLTITFTNSSFDLDGDPLAYFWNFGDGQSYSGFLPPLHVYSIPSDGPDGKFSISLKATDPQGLTSISNKMVQVIANHNPSANFSYKQTGPKKQPSQTSTQFIVAFNNLSKDQDNDSLRYLWSFGNGKTSTQTNPTMTYTNAKKVSSVKYNVSLTTNDKFAGSSSKTQTITLYRNLPTE